jgi:hypothetical protein
VFTDLPVLPPAVRQALLKFLKVPLDLGWLFGWRDLLLVLSITSMTYGVRLYSRPAAWIVGGLFALGLYYLMIRGAEQSARAARVEQERVRQEAERKRQVRGTIS